MMQKARQTWFQALLCLVWFASHAHADAEPSDDYTHLLRIQVAVELDGKRIDLDNTIFCGNRPYGTDEIRKTKKPLPIQYRVLHPAGEAGLIIYNVSWILCSLGQSVWRPGITPEREFKAPEGYLPVFSWYNSKDLSDATFGEMYVSETSVTAPNARLRLLSPMRFSIPDHPPTRQQVLDAVRRADIAVDHMRKRKLGVSGILITIDESDWSDAGELRQQAKKLWTNKTNPDLFINSIMSIAETDELVNITYLKKHDWFYPTLGLLIRPLRASLSEMFKFGVPRRGFQNDGRFGGQRRNQWSDTIRPMTCGPDDTAIPHPDRLGYRIELRRSDICLLPGREAIVELRGQRFRMPRKDALIVLYSPSEKRIYLILRRKKPRTKSPAIPTRTYHHQHTRRTEGGIARLTAHSASTP